LVGGATDVFDGVAGDAEDGRRKFCGGVEGADLSGGEFLGAGAQVDAGEFFRGSNVGARKSNVGTVVDEDARRIRQGSEREEKAAGELFEGRGGEIAFANLEEIEGGCEGEEASEEAGEEVIRRMVLIVSGRGGGECRAIGNQIPQHVEVSVLWALGMRWRGRRRILGKLRQEFG
jgi:hypothetical protein